MNYREESMDSKQVCYEAEKYMEFILPQHYTCPNSVHGIAHVKRTLVLALKLLDKEKIEEDKDRRLMAYACIYHDIGRTSDGTDLAHGYMSWRKLKKLKLLDEMELSDEYKRILQFIIVNHCIDDASAEKNILSYDISDQ